MGYLKENQKILRRVKACVDKCQYHEDYVRICRFLVKAFPRSFFNIAFSEKFAKLGTYISSRVSFANDLNNSSKIFYFIRNLSAKVKCAYCHKEISRNINLEEFTRTDFYCCNRCAQSSDEVIARVKQKKLENHGDANYNNTIKAKETCRTRYGVDYTTQSSVISEKMYIEKYTHLYQQIQADENVEPLFSLEDYLSLKGINRNSVILKWRCRHCNAVFESPIDFNWLAKSKAQSYARCLNCYPILADKSASEKELKQYIQTLTSEKIIDFENRDNRKLIPPYEIDIICPERKIGFEFDGLRWHADQMLRNPSYHLMKTERCNELGYQLIHVFENEWISKQEIVKSKIAALFGKHSHRFYARDCNVVKVPSGIARIFLDKCHLQGFCPSAYAVGLEKNSELVSIMTFGKSRYSKTCDWEMLRFCNALGCQVVGGASRLLKHFIQDCKPKSIVSYADRRWSTGKMYETLGFTLDHASAPNYWYFKKTSSAKLESRIKYQKYKLKQLLSVFDESKSEAQNMEDNGFWRIFDCGNLVYVKQVQE